jgi:choloylglycine hydrolase
MAALTSAVATPKSKGEALTLAYHLLNTVDIPYGAVRSAFGSDFDYTQWVVVKDLSGKRISYRTYNDLTPRMLDLMHLIEQGKKTTFPLSGAAPPTR